MNSAESKMNEGKFAEAAKLINKAINKADEDFQPRGDANEKLNEASNAASALELINKGNTMVKEGQWELARSKFKAADALSQHHKLQEILKAARANAKQKEENHNKALELLARARKEAKKENFEEALKLLDQALALAEVVVLVNELKKTKFETLSAYGFKKYEEGRTRERNQEVDFKKTQEIHKKTISIFGAALQLQPDAKKERDARQQVIYRYEANVIFNRAVEVEAKGSDLHKKKQFYLAQQFYERTIETFKNANGIYKKGAVADWEFNYTIEYTKKQIKSVTEVVECLNKDDLLRKLHKTDYKKKRGEALREQQEENANLLNLLRQLL